MKKTILLTMVLLVFVVIAGIFYVLTNLDGLVKDAIEKHGSEAVKTAVRVSSVRIDLADGAASINGLTVANPEGFSFPQAFSLGEVTVDIDIEKTSEELVAIDLIKIDAPQVFYEINEARKGNLDILKDNLGIKPAAKSKPSDSSADSPADSIKLSIASFVLSGAVLKAKIVPLKEKEYDLKLPTLKLKNLNGTPEEITRQILNQLIDHAKKEIKNKGLDKELAEMKAKVKARAKEKVDAAKSRVKDKASNKLDEKKQELGDKLKDMW